MGGGKGLKALLGLKKIAINNAANRNVATSARTVRIFHIEPEERLEERDRPEDFPKPAISNFPSEVRL